MRLPRLLALPLCIAGVALSLSGPQPMCSAPNPSAQLQAYDALLSEPSCVAATVLAREARTADTADSEAEEEEGWRVVGRVAASTDAGDRAETALAGAAQRQQRLIVEHACRLHKALRPAKRSPGIALGLDLGGDRPHCVAPAAAGEPADERMARSGFVGVPASRSARDLYAPAEGATESARAVDGVLPPSYFARVVAARPGDPVPWETGAPQPRVVRAAREGALRGAVLDCGCGLGQNAAHLVESRACASIVGFDLSHVAVALARTRCARAEAAATAPPPPCRLLGGVDCAALAHSPVADAARALEGGGFDVALDSALLHCLGDADARAYVRGLAAVVKPATGRALVGCFSENNPDPWDNPRRLSARALRELLRGEWLGDRRARRDVVGAAGRARRGPRISARGVVPSLLARSAPRFRVNKARFCR